MATNIGPKIGIEGEKEYRDALKNIIQQTKTLGSEMEAVAASFGKNADAQEKAAARGAVLDKQIKAQTELVEKLSEGLSKSVESYGEMDTRTLKMQQTFNKATAELSRMKGELADTQDIINGLDVDPNVDAVNQLKESLAGMAKQSKVLASEMEATTASFGKNADAQEKYAAQAHVLQKQIDAQRERVATLAEAVKKSAEAYGETSDETNDFRIELNKATAELSRMTRNMEDMGESMDKSAKGASLFGDMLKANLASEAIVAGIRKTADALKTVAASVINLGKQAISAFADREQLIGGVETLFGDAAGAVRDYAQNAFSTAGLSANEYMETVTGFSARLIAAVAGDTQLAAQKADMALRDMSDNANKMGTDMASIQNAYQGFAKQNYDMLDNLKLGYGGTKEEMQRLLADAQKLSGVTYNIDSFADIVDAIHVVQTEIGVTGTTAQEAAATITGSANAMGAAWKNLVAGFADSSANISGLVGGLAESVKNYLSNLLPAIGQFLPGLSAGLAEIVAQLAPFLVQSIQTLLPDLIGGVGTLLDAFLAALPTLFNVEFLSGITSQLLNMLPGIVQAGITLLMGLVDGFAAALPDLLSTVADVVVAIAEGLCAPENLPKMLEASIILMVGLADGLIEALPKLIDAIPEIVEALVVGLIDNAPKLYKAATELNYKIAAGMIAAVGQLVVAAGELVARLLKVIFVDTNWLQVGGDIINGILDGLKRAWDSLVRWFTNAWDGLVGDIKDILGIHSPSRVFADEIGKMIPPGIALGVDQALPKAIRDIQSGFRALPKMVMPQMAFAGGMTAPDANSYTNNLGGVSINVYGAPGQDEDALVRIIMERIDASVSRKGAVFA